LESNKLYSDISLINDFRHLLSGLHSNDQQQLRCAQEHQCPFPDPDQCPFLLNKNQAQFSSILTQIHLALQHPNSEQQQIVYRQMRERIEQQQSHNRFQMNVDDSENSSNSNSTNDNSNSNSNTTVEKPKDKNDDNILGKEGSIISHKNVKLFF
jgi:hypothetical protein